MDHQLQIPASLIHQCHLWITMHLEQLPVSQLSLLPLMTREELLLKLPIADVCQLEDKKFVKGIDMEKFWRSQCNLLYWREEILRYAKEKLLTNTEYYRSIFYGQIASCVIGCLSLFEFTSVCRDREGTELDLKDGNPLSFLYGVRKVDSYRNACQLVFPPRYFHESKFEVCDSSKDVIKAVVSCFQGKLPRILEVNVGEGYEADLEYAHFIREVEFLNVCGFLFDDAKGFDF